MRRKYSTLLQYNLLLGILLFVMQMVNAQTIPEMIAQLQQQNTSETRADVLAGNNRKIANYYTYLFELDKAKVFIEKAIDQATESKNYSELLFAQLTRANILYNELHVDSALSITNGNAYLLNLITDKSQAQFAEAYYYIHKGKLLNANFRMDSALVYADKALELLDKKTKDKDEQRLLLNIAFIKAQVLSRKGNKDAAVSIMIDAIKLAEKGGDKLDLRLAYFNYASLFGSVNGSEESVQYFLKAAEMAKQLDLQGEYGNMLAEAGAVYFRMGNYSAGYTHLHDALPYIKNYALTDQYIRALTDFSELLVEMDSLSHAEAMIREAISLQDLSTLTFENFTSLVQLSEILNAKGDYDAQWEVITVADKLVEESKLEDCIITLKREKVNYYSGVGNFKEAYQLLAQLKAFDDSVKFLEKQQTITELNLQYETEKKDTEIALLNAQQEISNTHLSRQRIAIIGSSALAILFGIAGFAIFKRIQLKRETDLKIERLERLNEIQNLRSNIALDMHDDIGASLSSIRMYSEAAKTKLKENAAQSETFLQKISENANEIVQNMSDIVWAINPKYDEIKNLQSRMRSFATDLCAANEIVPEFIWDDNAQLSIPMEKRRNMYLIFKEAVNNAVKYSNCKTLTIRLYIEEYHLNMQVQDDGDGFDSNIVDQGNGLKNMKLRAKEIDGNLHIITKTNQGTVITFNMLIT